MSDFKHARVESAGPAFVASVRRHRLKRGLEEDTQLQEALDEAAQENAEEDEDEEESPLLLQSDPNNWKVRRGMGNKGREGEHLFGRQCCRGAETCFLFSFSLISLFRISITGTRSLCCSRSVQEEMAGNRGRYPSCL